MSASEWELLSVFARLQIRTVIVVGFVWPAVKARLWLERGTYEAADESADHRSAKHAPVVFVVVATMVAAVVVVVLRFTVLRGRRGVPCDLVPVGGLGRLDVSAGGSLGGMLCGRGRLCSHSGWSLALCRSAALRCGSGGSAKSAAKCECHHQLLQCLVVHGRVPFIITRKPILALTQGKENSAPLSDNSFLRLVRHPSRRYGIMRGG